MGYLDPTAGMNFLQSQGWTPVAAAGILGNAFGESNFNGSAIGDNGAAHGLFQTHTSFHPGYSRDFTPMQQLAYASNELKTKYPSLSNALNSATSGASAAELFMRGYERPANSSSLGKRIASAQSLLQGGTGLVKAGKGLVASLVGDAADTALHSIPGVGAAMDVFGIHPFGGGDSCGILCQIKNWIADSGFFQRLALAVLAFIVLGAAFYLVKPTAVNNIVKGAVAA